MAISTSRLDEEVAGLKALVEEQRQRLDALESTTNAGGGDVHSRRNLLKLAGAGLVGAAGAAALRVMPASAATGGNFILGNANQADTQTQLQLTSTVGSGANAGVNNVYTLQADATNAGTLTGSTNIIGVEAIGFNSGAGVAAVSSSGPGGAFGSSTGPDLQLGGVLVNKTTVGSGRLAQLMRTGVAAAGPTFTAAGSMAELIRGTDASLWLSTTGTSSTASANWKRMNTVRVDKADGTGGAFTPARIIDTRSTIGTAGSTLPSDSPLQPGVTYTFGPFTGTNGLPLDAIGIVGNLTVVGFTGAGFVSLFPGGIAWPGNSSLNFGGEFANSGWANAYTVGFGTGANAGKISIRLSSNGITSHVIVDVAAYLQ